MLNLVIFALLFVLMWKFKKKPSGLALAGYLFGYGTVRSIMEPLRDPQFILGSSMPVSQVLALIMAFGGLTLAICLLIWNYKKYGRLFGADDEAEGSAVLPVYYTAEQRRKAEEERRRREAARAAVKRQGPPAPSQAGGTDGEAAPQAEDGEAAPQAQGDALSQTNQTDAPQTKDAATQVGKGEEQ